MKCWKCGKDTGSGKSEGITFSEGIKVDVEIDEVQKTPESIAYFNKQLGKYSDGQGECHVAICYECYIDGLFHVK